MRISSVLCWIVLKEISRNIAPVLIKLIDWFILGTKPYRIYSTMNLKRLLGKLTRTERNSSGYSPALKPTIYKDKQPRSYTTEKASIPNIKPLTKAWHATTEPEK